MTNVYDETGVGYSLTRRPDPRIAAYALLDPVHRDAGLHRLATDLESGVWKERHGDLLELDALDLGYRLIIAEHGARADRIDRSAAPA